MKTPAAIAHQGAARGRREQIAERIDAIGQGAGKAPVPARPAHSCFISVSAFDTSALPGESSTLRLFTTPSSTIIE